MRPESATARQESELADKSGRELQAGGLTGDPVKRLTLLCLSRGATGILELGRKLREMADDGDKLLSFAEFLDALKEIGLEISETEAKSMFDSFDTDNTGLINVAEVLVAVRPPMHGSRMRVIEETFKKMDKSGHGVITLEDLKHGYNVKADPIYISGTDSEEHIIKKFLNNFDQEGVPDVKVTKEDYINYYSAVSASIDNDCYFDLIMRQAYKL